MKTIKDLYINFAINTYGKNNSLMFNQSPYDSFVKITFDSFFDITSGFIKLLLEQNLKNSDKICIIANTSAHWIACDFAVMSLGLVSVPIFTNTSLENIIYQVQQTSPSIFFVQDYSLKEKLLSINIKEDKIFYINTTKPTKPSVVIEKFNKTIIHQNDLATIVYTSGTSGKPNGVMISHFNLISQILNSSRVFKLTPQDVAISFLPTAHIFQRMICFLYIYEKVSIYFINDYTTLIENLKTIKPTLLTTVPRVLEKAYIKIANSFDSKTGLTKIIAKMAKKYANNTNPLKKRSFFRGILSKLYTKIVFSKILAVFGGNIRMIISGGAKLNDDVYRFFVNIGLPVYQGYGMTETSPVIASNNPSQNKCYTVGKFFDNIEYKILEDGELCVKGDNLMLGYYDNPQETAKSFDGEYFKTGDIVEVDKDGFLTVKSRKKELFKTSNGKYVDPNKIEFLLSKSQIIEYSCIIADGKNFVSAIIFSKTDNLEAIKLVVQEANKNLDHHEKIVKYHISRDDLSPQTGELTPSLKLRRFIIYDKYKSQIESFYAQ
jgi:long-chain acyl-CoA synthetase